jgi:tetrahydromethanopterin:alpha-L-glutamate ligase
MTEGSLRIGVVGRRGGWSSEALADAVQERTGFRLLVDVEEVVLDLERGRARAGEVDLGVLDALIVKKVGDAYGPVMLERLELLRWIAEGGVRVFSKPASILRVVDRLACTVTLARRGVPMPPTVVTERVDRAADAVRRFGTAVLKPLYSTRGRGMRVVSADGPDLEDELGAFRDAGNPVLYVQQKVEIGDRDFCLVFVGGAYVGAYARVRGHGSWNTTIHNGGSYERHEASPEIVALAHRAQAPFDLAFTSVDIVLGEEGRAQVLEVSAFGGFRGLRDGLGIDPAARYADYVIGRMR